MKVVIIGGGPAGMLSAISAGTNKNDVTINELYMTIVSNEKPKTRIRKVISCLNKKKPKYFYVVTISKKIQCL